MVVVGRPTIYGVDGVRGAGIAHPVNPTELDQPRGPS